MAMESGTIFVGKSSQGIATPDSRPIVIEEKEADKDPVVALNDLAAASDDILYEAKSVFPFDLWPDKIRVGMSQVEIIYKKDPISKYIYPITIDKILTVRVHKGLLFSEIQLEIQGHEQDPSTLKFLKNKDAEEATQLILGLKTAHNEKIDLQQIPRQELVEKLKQIASTQITL